MKNSSMLFIAFLLLSTSCSTRKDFDKTTTVPDATPYVNQISKEQLKEHLYVIASDEMEGRNTGEKGQKKAGEYLINYYKSIHVPFPKGAKDYYQPISASFFKKEFSPRLGDSENIWAFIEGSDKPEEILVISAHYDHVGMKNGEIFNGADDDGSGTVALLELAKVFTQAKKDGNGPKRSILFLHVTGEEHGLHGSRYYTLNPLFPLKNTIANINIDMIGRRGYGKENNDNYIYVIGSDRLSTDLHNISEIANTKYTQMELDYKYNDLNDPNRFYYRSDHYNFAKNGIPSIFYFNGVHDDYHKATDTPDKIDYPLLTKRTQLIFTVAWNLANTAERPNVDKDGK
jgi:hypothetical protein